MYLLPRCSFLALLCSSPEKRAWLGKQRIKLNQELCIHLGVLKMKEDTFLVACTQQKIEQNLCGTIAHFNRFQAIHCREYVIQWYQSWRTCSAIFWPISMKFVYRFRMKNLNYDAFFLILEVAFGPLNPSGLELLLGIVFLKFTDLATLRKIANCQEI